jgi:hypothetical protein
MEAQRNHRCCCFGTPYAKYAALFAQLVVVERMRCEHRESYRGG